MLENKNRHVISIKEHINEDIINDIINFKEHVDLIDYGDKVYTLDDFLKGMSNPILNNNSYKKLKKLLINYEIHQLELVYALYYYGRGFIDGSTGPRWSFWDDVEQAKNESFDVILDKFDGITLTNLKEGWKAAFDNYENHEKNIDKEKEIWRNRLTSYTKHDKWEFFLPRKTSIEESTSNNFNDVLKELANDSTTDIYQAKAIIEKIIEITGGLVVVDFLNLSNFDRLDHVDCDDEFLKLYWKYSRGDKQYPNPPHNTRVDIAFEQLRKINFAESTGIILKGFYREKSEIKNYYFNKEKIRKSYFFHKMNDSQFHYHINFDKWQRGALENFNVSFLPWRHFNVIILPKKGIGSSTLSAQLLILQNIVDIHNRGVYSYNEFKLYINTMPLFEKEDAIMMFGNRFRKITENYIKFILLASKIMFEKGYEKDMLGSLISQMKKEYDSSRNSSFYNRSMLKPIINLIECSMLEKLNLTSHDNTTHRIDTEIIDQLYFDFIKLKDLALSYFDLNT